MYEGNNHDHGSWDGKYTTSQKNNYVFFIIIRNVSYYYDFWRSCDSEDWSNDAENTEINYSYIFIHTENSCIQYITLLLYFWSNKAKKIWIILIENMFDYKVLDRFSA